MAMRRDVEKDQMTPKERMKALREGKPLDRIPCILGVSDHAARLIGAKTTELLFNPDKVVEAQVAARKVYDIQVLNAAPGLTGMAEAIGCKVEYPEDRAPYIAKHVVEDSSDLDRLEIPDPNKSGRLPVVLETAKKLQAALGSELPLSVGFTGPFTVAAQIRGTEQFMRDLYRDPEFAHRLLRFALDSDLAFLKEAAKIEGVDFSIGEPTASGSLISKKMFREYCFPYLKELVDAMKKVGGEAPSIHICGNTKKIWDDVADTGVGSFSIDDKMDLREAKNAIGDRVILMGNVKPIETMYLGTPEDVEKDVKECLKKAYDTPKGYVLALGCGLPRGTPPENIHALLDSVRRFGQYPFNLDNFS
ncbi:MAG: uroporphyrinogen decarboxylase family protein [Clostridiales bacterium]|jgi:uroporphyrinogen decarboxylase|nr:uroporphyrinogen decarboxylase family protein [Eubacteriales bacterium]MDH7566039.1 uroporphyrinogen decarboxylase family protein [Clostridiales bacterium]